METLLDDLQRIIKLLERIADRLDDGVPIDFDADE